MTNSKPGRYQTVSKLLNSFTIVDCLVIHPHPHPPPSPLKSSGIFDKGEGILALSHDPPPLAGGG